MFMSTKATETWRSYFTVSLAIYFAERMEKMLYGDIKDHINVEIVRDSELLLRSSTKWKHNINIINLIAGIYVRRESN